MMARRTTARPLTGRSPRGRRDARGWPIVTLAVAAVAITVWIVASWLRGGVEPGDVIGTTFGILATCLLLLAMFYGVRRRAMPTFTKYRWGSSRRWLQLHLYGSVLFLVMFLLHSGMRLPVGVLSWALWLLSLWTVASGGLGLLLQRIIPRLLASGPAMEVNFDRIPELVTELRRRAELLVASAEAPLRAVYERDMAPAMAGARRDPLVFLNPGGGGRKLERLEHLRRLFAVEERQRVDELEELYQAKLDLDAHFTLQHLLRAWLWLHVPAATLLTVLVIVHIAAVLVY